jgi:hypothetical protein
MTAAALKAQIDLEISNKTAASSITPLVLGENLRDSVDFVVDYSATLQAETFVNKSTNVVVDGLSDVKYPSVKSIKDYADSIVVGLLDDRGNYNASTNVFPSSGGSGGSGAILKGDLFFISVTGTLGGVSVPVGASLRALVNTPGQTSTNWNILNVGLGYTAENVVNKSLNITTDATSDVKYPSVKAVKTYVDANVGSPQTLQQVVDLGNVITGAFGTQTIYANLNRFDDTTTGEFGIYGLGSFNKSNGVSAQNIDLPATLSGGIKTITFPNANGVVALNAQLPTVSGNYANDSAAATGGVLVGNMYHTSGTVKIRLT